VSLGARGWDNQLWRLGDDLAVRLPWATGDADELLRKEHRWVPTLAPHLPLPVPVPQRLGVPSALFPRPWLITTWVPGTPADRSPVTGGALLLAEFLTALHRPAPAGAPTGRGRGGPLADHAFARGLAAATGQGLLSPAEAGAAQAVWDDAVAAPAWTGPPVWLHADLHPANVLTAGGAICGVVDFGDLCAGDPAYDLAAAWILLPEPDACLAAYRPAADAATLRRARGCALTRALSGLLIANQPPPSGKPTWAPPARAALHRLLATA
jgi:aminoglycoside phosphotransferase (APT) family kinase protein